ncbi:hypothetical protein EST38_g8151 [Candolleomyces aberdarensis]|uniref:F-box domain-containing protein n=1 Tax=Candolleomyces aberdarensis TaxID=2316362 RepID=A0A4Q2DDA3_9AGAR|nr:hypothetical protein EST38_g8151 [Candolleomyces aberdarensis]
MADTDQQDLRRPKRVKHPRSTEPTGKPSKKPGRERKPVRNAEKAGAILSYMGEMPLDVLLEFCDNQIFSHLEPADLIHLSRTTKALRSVMMNRSSRSIWTQALASIPGLPPCPDDLIEAKYANLMFTDYCHECLANADDDPSLLLLMFMEARTQLCHKCAPLKFKTARAFSSSFSKIKSLVPMTKEKFSKYGQGWSTEKYHVDIGNELIVEYDYIAQEEREQWLQEQSAKRKAISEHAEACEIFFQARLMRDEQLIASLHSKRRDQIIERLKELGLNEEVCYPEVRDELKKHHLVSSRYKQAISDEEWEDIEPEVLEWVEQQTAKHDFKQEVFYVERRVKEWFIPIYAEFMASRLPQVQTVHPTLLEISSLEEFRAALEDTPLNENPSPEVTQAAIAQLPEFVDRWRQTHDDALLKLIKQSHPSKHQGISRDTLFHAVTSFECESCHAKGLLYPDVFTHPCNFLPSSRSRTSAPPTKYKAQKRKRDPQSGNKKEVPGTLIKEVFKKVIPLSTSHLRFSEAGYLHTIQVLDLLGLAHDTNSKDLKSKAPLLECHCFCYDDPRNLWEPSVQVNYWPNLVSSRPPSMLGSGSRR